MEKLNQFLTIMKDQSFEYYTNLFIDFKNTKDYRVASKELLSKVSKSMYMFMTNYFNLNHFQKDLNELLEKELKNKKENLIMRVEAKGGKIIDALNLTLGNDNSLNGYIKCENKDVKVETIFAGGYNIQCLHYRVIVK
jgi:hypothetical protein